MNLLIVNRFGDNVPEPEFTAPFDKPANSDVWYWTACPKFNESDSLDDWSLEKKKISCIIIINI